MPQLDDDDSLEFLIGCQDSNIHKITKDYEKVNFVDKFSGHSKGVRSMEITKDKK